MSMSKALGIVSGINEAGNFFQLFRSAISYLRSRWNNGEQEQQIQEVQEQQIQEHEVWGLQSDLQILSQTLPSMYDLIDRAEWRSHKRCVAQLLPKLNDAVYDAEDLIDEFRWYEIKASKEGNSSAQLSSLIEFFRSVIQGRFNKVTNVQKRLSHLSSQLEKMGLHEANPRFDKSVRPVTTSFPTEAKIFGRENEIEEVIRLLGVPNNCSRSSSKRKRASNTANNEPRVACVPVLPIVGMGGVGKTTLAQEITVLQRVKSYFDKIIWICVSDEFDAELLTKVFIKSLSGKEAILADNFDDLQRDLAHAVGNKKFLLILDDIWHDIVLEDGRNWRKFYAPLKNALQGSMLLVTTRFAEVAKIVATKEYFELEYFELKGLKPEVFWDLFKACVFGSESYHINPQLEQIGKKIAPKLDGSPLAATTIGRLLRNSLTIGHWNDILNSELWQLPQKQTEILPALRLSYMYLPFHLKRCFSFCAIYPKDYNYDKVNLAEIWAAEGFVEPQGNFSLQHIGGQYFEDLVNLSFFQKLRGKYVIHDLMHDMAQLVSKDECFIVKKPSDIEKVPQNVRHLSIVESIDFKFVNLTSLCKHEKLRTLLCKKSLYNDNSARVINQWITELKCLRVISLASTKTLPRSITTLKHLRYLEISRALHANIFPSSFCHLYNLQILYAKSCLFGSLPTGSNNPINLQKIKPKDETYALNFDAIDWGKTFLVLNNITIENLILNDMGLISKDHAAKLSNMGKMEYLNCLTLKWSSSRSQEHIGIEVLQALNSSANKSLKSLHLKGYPGEYLPWGSHPSNFLTLASPLFVGSDRLEENIDQNEQSVMTLGSNNGGTGSIFSSLKNLRIEGAEQLSSLEQFLQPYCVPAIKNIIFENCPRLSLQSSKVGDLSCLEELIVYNCPNIISGGLFAPYLKKLTLRESRNFVSNLTSILKLEIWSLPALQELRIIEFSSITFITKANVSHHSSINSSTGTLPLLTDLTIENCRHLKNIDGLLSHDCLPAIRKICIRYCAELQILPGERFGSFSSLRDLVVEDCLRVNWHSGMVLPSSLRSLTLCRCGDISSGFSSCLENLDSLDSLELRECEHIVSIPDHLWRTNLHSLTRLVIIECPDLESIGGPNAIAHVRLCIIHSCAKLKDIGQPFMRLL